MVQVMLKPSYKMVLIVVNMICWVEAFLFNHPTTNTNPAD